MDLEPERRSQRRVLRCVAVLLLVTIAVLVAARPSARESFVAGGPPLAAPAAGELTDLSPDQFAGVLVGLRGKPVLVNVWASWCAPCRTETPLLERTWETDRSALVIIGVNASDQRSAARSFMNEFDVTFANIFDASGEIRRNLGVRGFPSTYVFGADGRLRTTVLGGPDRTAAGFDHRRRHRMRDFGLLASMVLVLAVPALLVRPWPDQGPDWSLLDRVGPALAVGLLVGRLSAVVLDDRRSLTSLPDLLVIRSGVEFWPGVAAGLAWLGWKEHRSGHEGVRLLAIVAPAGLIAWAVYEASCLLRDGCPGPISSIGLRPAGLVQRQFPVGIVVAILALLASRILSRARRVGLGDIDATLLAVAAVAFIRTLASFWLPKVGVGLTRQHKMSITVLMVCAFVLLIRRRRQRLPTT